MLVGNLLDDLIGEKRGVVRSEWGVSSDADVLAAAKCNKLFLRARPKAISQ